MLAGMIHLMRGTPYIYQGEEIGMPNAHYPSIEQYQDVESLNYYEILLKKGKTKEEALKTLAARSRDNSRTPMQWNVETYGGFSEAKPWLPMSAGFRKEITVEAQQKDDDSILAFYKKLIALRKQTPIMVYGKYEPLFEDSEDWFVYTRTLDQEKLLVVCSFSENPCSFQIPEEFHDATCLISNMSPCYSKETTTLRPYEAFVLLKQS